MFSDIMYFNSWNLFAMTDSEEELTRYKIKNLLKLKNVWNFFLISCLTLWMDRISGRAGIQYPSVYFGGYLLRYLEIKSSIRPHKARSVLFIIFNIYYFYFSLSWLHSLTLLPINSNTVNNNNNNNNDQSKNHNNDDDATVKTKIEIKSEEPEEAAAAVYPQERHKLHLYIHYMYIVHTHIRLFSVFAVPISLLCDVWGDYIYTYQ